MDGQLRAAIGAAKSGACLDNLARLVWRGNAEGYLSDDIAQELGEAVEARRALFRDRRAFPAAKAASGPRRPPRSPDRQASLERRRRVAASGAMPPALACQFTGGELAALSIIAREFQRRGRCELPIDAIAALSGTSRSTVKSATRQATRLGLLTMVERRRRGRPSETNIITLIDRAWLSWLRLGGRGVKNQTTTVTSQFTQANSSAGFGGLARGGTRKTSRQMVDG